MKRLLYTWFCCLLLVSCYQEIDLEEYRTTPKPVINSVVSSDDVITASVSRTWFFPETLPYVHLPQAQVSLYINDRYVEQMEWKTKDNPLNPNRPDTLFLSTTIPAEGDRIRIVVSTPEYGTAEAEDIIPQRTPISKVEHSIRQRQGMWQGTWRDYYEISYEVTFDDAPGTDNYYLAKITGVADPANAYHSFLIGEIDYIDPLFKEQDAIIDSGLSFDGLNKDSGALFTDRNINGQTYTLQLKEYITSLDESELRIVSLYSLSEAYYLYLLSLQKVTGSTLEGGLGNIGLAEPILIYSNVEGGTGILGGYQHADAEITLNNYTN
ncbi:MAG: DUF4249 domain-containing protein [Bacteroidales bacterium]|nr:DUF4249 domain-containing protein [Bacteroidales bacterium]